MPIIKILPHAEYCPEGRQIEALIEQAQAARTGSDADRIEHAVEALAEGTEAFAAARMNQGIRQALSGRRLDEV